MTPALQHDTTATTSIRQAKERLASIQALRGLAAVAVAVFHTHLILAQPEYGGLDVLSGIASKGWLGLNFFFVLSGFIIMNAHASDIGVPARAATYCRKRFIRIYPVYWIVLTVYLGLAIGHPGPSKFSWSFINLVSSYLLVDVIENLQLPLQVAWTLIYELRFYVVFLLLILNRKIGYGFVFVWFCGIILNNINIVNYEFGMLHIWNIYFIVGMIIYFASKRIPNKYGSYILIAGVISLIALLPMSGVNHVGDLHNNPLLFCLSVCFGLILLGSVLFERHSDWAPPAFFVELGSASYSVYLVHSMLISIIAFINHRVIFGRLPPELVFVAACTLSIAGGMLFHRAVERPLLDYLGGRMRSRRPVAVPATAEQA